MKSPKKKTVPITEETPNDRFDDTDLFDSVRANKREAQPVVEEPKNTKAPLFEMLDDIRFKKENLMRHQPVLYTKEFSLYVVNRFLSSELANIYYVQDMNMWGTNLTKEQQYDFLCYGIPKNKKWLSYPKKDKLEKITKYIMEYFSFSREKAEVASKILTEEQIDEIIGKFEKHLK